MATGRCLFNLPRLRLSCKHLQAPYRCLRISAGLSGDAADLEKAKERLATLTEDPGNEVKLKLYGLFKQVRLLFFLSGV